jgi:hypothetical protein
VSSEVALTRALFICAAASARDGSRAFLSSPDTPADTGPSSCWLLCRVRSYSSPSCSPMVALGISSLATPAHRFADVWQQTSDHRGRMQGVLHACKLTSYTRAYGCAIATARLSTAVCMLSRPVPPCVAICEASCTGDAQAEQAAHRRCQQPGAARASAAPRSAQAGPPAQSSRHR